MAAAGDRADFARFLQHAAAAISLLPALIHIYKADGGILTIARGRGWAGAEGRALAARATAGSAARGNINLIAQLGHLQLKLGALQLAVARGTGGRAAGIAFAAAGLATALHNLVVTPLLGKRPFVGAMAAGPGRYKPLINGALHAAILYYLLHPPASTDNGGGGRRLSAVARSVAAADAANGGAADGGVGGGALAVAKRELVRGKISHAEYSHLARMDAAMASPGSPTPQGQKRRRGKPRPSPSKATATANGGPVKRKTHTAKKADRMPAGDGFEAAAERVKGLAKGAAQSELLALYGLFKQATKGDVTAGGNPSRPSVFDPRGRAKWDAWRARGGLTSADARGQYVAEVEKLAAKQGR